MASTTLSARHHTDAQLITELDRRGLALLTELDRRGLAMASTTFRFSALRHLTDAQLKTELDRRGLLDRWKREAMPGQSQQQLKGGPHQRKAPPGPRPEAQKPAPLVMFPDVSKILDKLYDIYESRGFLVVIAGVAVFMLVCYYLFNFLEHLSDLTGIRLSLCKLDFGKQDEFKGLKCELNRPVKLRLNLEWDKMLYTLMNWFAVAYVYTYLNERLQESAQERAFHAQPTKQGTGRVNIR